MKLTNNQFNLIYELLVSEAGAKEKDRDFACQYFTSENRYGHEWRFGGKFGAGGKLHTSDYTNKVFISYYWENEKPELNALRDSLNEKIQKIMSE